MKKRTTIQLEKEIREMLVRNKKYKRETYSDQIKRLLQLQTEGVQRRLDKLK